MTERDQSTEIHQMGIMLGGLKQAVESMTSQWRQQETDAADGRRRLHDRFEAFQTAVNATLGSLSSRVVSMEKQITLIEPSVTIFKEERLRDEGAKRLGTYLWGAILTVAGLAGWGIHELVGFLFHKVP